ncbi:hypothetical protein VZO05_02565 [Aggregatilineales bacterium SYSU G02658]
MTLKYGLAVEKWDEAVAEIRAILQQAARERRYLTYGEVTQAMLSVRAHPGAYVFTAMLREACHQEERETGVQLCALVVAKATGRPGAGYFRMMPCSGDLDDCWRAEAEAAFNYYRETSDA